MIQRLSRLVLAAVVLALASGCAIGHPGFRGMGHGRMGPGRIGPGDGFHMMTRVVCRAPADLPGRRVDVVLMDGMPMAGMLLRARPVRIHSGPVTFVATNRGRRTHELVVLPLRPAEPAGVRRVVHGRVDERASLGEASASCAAGEGDGIRPGRTGWVTLDLPPGRYELVCNEPHHYAAGMYQALVVDP